MSGRIVYEPHGCQPPTAAHNVGTIWRCDCGRHHKLIARNVWHQVHWAEIALLRAAGQLAAELSKQPVPTKVVHVPETISHDEADQIRRAIGQVESKSSGS